MNNNSKSLIKSNDKIYILFNRTPDIFLGPYKFKLKFRFKKTN